MKTFYYSTAHFIRHEGNLVDLNEFRLKRSLAQEGSLAPKLDSLFEQTPQNLSRRTSRKKAEPTPVSCDKTSRRPGHQTAWILDACASLGVLIMTLSFAISYLLS